MNKRIFYTVILVLITGFSIAQSKEKTLKIIEDAQHAKEEFLESDFEMKKHFEEAYGYAIFPNVGKGAIGIGGAAGTGAVYEKGKLIGIANLSQVSIGFQFGGQAYREIIFFENEYELKRFKNNKVKFAAQASAVACTEGASADAQYVDGVMIFTMQKGGLMYEASVGGQKFKFKPFEKKKKKRIRL